MNDNDDPIKVNYTSRLSHPTRDFDWFRYSFNKMEAYSQRGHFG